MFIDDTISAIATASGEAGIGIVRISGENAIGVADEMFRAASGRKISDMESHRAAYGRIVDESGEEMDEAIALLMRSPASYTGEDVVEIQCHGGRMALSFALGRSYEAGARPAERGEFTKRAFLNGKMDLSKAQSVMDIVQARTDASFRVAAGRLSGRSHDRVVDIRLRILGIIAHLEAMIDFPEEGLERVSIPEIRKNVVDIVNEIDSILRTAPMGRILRDGIKTTIIGKPNVGKSSLMNALLKENRAIVTDIPGTTRDSIEEWANVGGIPLCLTDTAGIRHTDDMVEQIGVERARSEAVQASLILALFDGSDALTDDDAEIMSIAEGRSAILLITKSDLPVRVDISALRDRMPSSPLLEVSSRTGAGIEDLARTIAQQAGASWDAERDVFIRDEREERIMREAMDLLSSSVSAIDLGLGEDFISIDLRSAWEKLGEFTGENVGDDVIDEIFSRFCIGK